VTSPSDLIAKAIHEGVAVANDANLQVTPRELAEKALWELEADGWTVNPRRDPELLRAETLRSMVTLGYLVSVITPFAYADGIGMTMHRAGAPLWASIAIPGAGAAGIAWVMSRMAWAMKQFAEPTDKFRKRAAAAYAERTAAVAAEEAAADAAYQAKLLEERQRLIAGIAQAIRETRPEKQ
jgi:hypothetical protein